MSKLLPAFITGAFLTLIAMFIGQLAGFAPAPYALYLLIVSQILIGIIPLLVDNGVIPALGRYGGLPVFITGTLLRMIGQFIASFATFAPSPYSVVFIVVGGAFVVIAQVLVANGVIPALRKT
jgi:hypothetical protein